MAGGAGNDTYHVDRSSDRVIEEQDGGTDTVVSTLTLSLVRNVERLVLSGNRNIDGSGNGGDNVLTGNAWANSLDGAGGDDLLIGGAGGDRLTGGRGSDTFRFLAADEFGPGRSRDAITDFGSRSDFIDLSSIDANKEKAGNQRFVFIGDDRMDGQSGELSYRGGLLSGDTDGDGKADFQVHLDDARLDASHLLL